MRVNETQSKLEGLGLRASGVGELLERYGRQADAFRFAATEQLVALQAGEDGKAREIGSERSGPAYEAITLTIGEIQSSLRRRAERQRLLADLSIGSIILAALLLAAILYILKRRAYERGEVAAARASETRFRALVQNSSDTILVVGSDDRIRLVTGASHRTLGRDASELEGGMLIDFVHPEDADAVSTLLATAAAEPRQALSGSWRMQGADGTWLDIEAVGSNLGADESVGGTVLTLRDVSERNRREARLHHRAFHDPLTQLVNRALFYDRVEHALSGRARDGRLVAVLFVDLDDFKLANDRYGHAVGDELIVAVGSRLRNCIRSSDTAARLGGDEFGILLEGAGGPGEPVHVAERILAALREPVTVQGESHLVSASIGIAIAADGETVDEVLRRADAAMYVAKGHGKRGWELHGGAPEPAVPPALTESHERDRGRITWLARNEDRREEILSLFEGPGRVQPVFQPIVDLRTGLVAGYEALSRFPGHASRPPNAWFAQARRCGLGPRLEAHVLKLALRQPGRPEGTFLSVNVSPSALASEEVAQALPERLDGIVLEVTENEVVGDDASLRALIAGLRQRGARLAVDDSGTGHAGLRQLMRLEPDLIKLDRSLVHDAHADRTKAALVEAFVRFAASIGADVCAEGVESLSDLVALSEMDVTHAQGFVIAPPGEPWAAVSADVVAACATSLPVASREMSGALYQTGASHLVPTGGALSDGVTHDGLAEVLRTIAHEIAADDIHVSRIDGDHTHLETLCSLSGRDVGERFPLAKFPRTARVVESGELVQVRVSDPRADRGEVEFLRNHGQGALLMVPVVSGGRSIGLLEVMRVAPRPFSRLELRRTHVLSSRLAALVERWPGETRPASELPSAPRGGRGVTDQAA
jgi:diguanylate cyclase (GGDEF)-like protein/PAS domain S-box-containing protein